MSRTRVEITPFLENATPATTLFLCAPCDLLTTALRVNLIEISYSKFISSHLLPDNNYNKVNK